MELRTKRLVMRTICPEDWTDLKRIWNDFGKSEYAKFDVPHDKSDDEIKKQAKKWHDNGLYFAVCLKEKATMIGYLAFHQNNHFLDIGYCFDSAYHRLGYAKESILAFIQYFYQQGIDTFTAGTGLENTPSVSLLRSLGFRQIGTEQVSFYTDEMGNPIYFEGGIFELKLNKTTESLSTKDGDAPELNLGQTLKHYRSKNGYSQENVAKQLHISRQLLSHWENNRRIPDDASLEKLSGLYQVPLDMLTYKPTNQPPIKPSDKQGAKNVTETDSMVKTDVMETNITESNKDDFCVLSWNNEQFHTILLLAIVVLLFLSNSVPVLGALVPIGYFIFYRKLTSRPVWMNVLALLCLVNQLHSLFVYVSHWLQVGKLYL